MSYIVYDYTCPACTYKLDDHFVKRANMDSVECPECGENMRRLPSVPNLDWDSLAMGDSASPEAISHWERKHKQRKAQEAKSKAEHGDYGPAAGA